MIEGEASAMKAKSRHQTTPGIAEGFQERRGLSWTWKGKENQQMVRGAACDVPTVKGERFLLEQS